MKHSVKTIFFLGFVPLLLSSCFTVEKSYPEKRYYVLDAATNSTETGQRKAEILRVQRFRVSPRYEGKGFVYRRGELRYESDFYNEFLVSPSSLLSEEVRKSLAASGLFRQVIGTGSQLDSVYVLEGNIAQLYGDFRPGGPPRAVLEVEVFLIRETEINSVAVFERTYLKTVELNRRSPDSLVQGWNEALRQILAELEGDLSQLNY